MNRVERWEVDILHEDSGEYMVVELGEEMWDDEEPLTEAQVIEIIMNSISIIPRFVGVE